MNKNKELEIVLNMLKSKFAYSMLSVEECNILLNYIKELEEKINKQDEIISNFNNIENHQNAQIFASWQQDRFDNIYRKYYLIYNGATFNINIYSDTTNHSNLYTIPTYLNGDLQLFLQGKCGLDKIEPIDYNTFNRVFGGV